MRKYKSGTGAVRCQSSEKCAKSSFFSSPITVQCRVAGDLLESEALTVFGAVGAVEDEIDFHMLLLGRAGLSQKGLCIELSDLHVPF